MKNRRVLYIFITLVVIVGVVLVSSVLFSIKETQVSVRGENRILRVSDISDKLNNYNGKNIFFIDKQQIIDEIAEIDPYAAVINVERVFPSKVIVHIYERTEAYSVALEGGKYAAVDKTGKVLNIRDDNYASVYLQGGNTGQMLQNVLLKTLQPVQDIKVNAYITGEDAAIAYSLFSFYSASNIDEHMFRALFKSVEVFSDYNSGQNRTFYRLVLTTRAGAIIEIGDSGSRLAEKAAHGYNYLNKLSDIQRKTAEIYVYEDADGSIYANGPKL